jgi:hypothetical protein
MEPDYSEVLLELKRLLKEIEGKLVKNKVAEAIDISTLVAANGRRLRYILEKQVYGY